jgi:hypothetical protein
MLNPRIPGDSYLKSPKLYRRTTIKFNYIWQASIPDSWNRIMSKASMQKLNLIKRSRNTLEFLEETQKYINKICPPLRAGEVEITPTSLKTENRKKMFQLLSHSRDSLPRKLSPIGRLARRKKSLKIQDSDFLVRNWKNANSCQSPALVNHKFY